MFGGQEVETKRFDKVSNKMRLQDEDGFRLVYLQTGQAMISSKR